MKMLKMLFSRFPILVLAIVIQAAALGVALTYYAEYFFWLETAGLVVALAVFLHMIHRDTSAEAKLPWTFLLIVTPLFGTVLYIFLANPKIRRKQNEELSRIENVREELLASSNEYRQALLGTLGEHTGVENYLTASAYSRGYLNNRVAYFGDGAAFFDDLCRSLEEAEQFIFMEYFIIEHGAVWDKIHEILLRKRREGVEVRILYDDFGSLGKLSGNYHKRLISEGIECRRFNPIRPVLSGIFNYRDHRKITVIDGKIGYTGGMNIGDEYAGLAHPYGRWKDSSLRIEGPSVGNLTFLFLQLYDTTDGTTSEYAKYFLPIPSLDGTGGYVHAFGCGPLPFYREQIAENTFLNMIGAARRRVYVTTPYLITDRALMTALKNAAKRGVDVRIVTPHIPDKKLVFQLTRASYRPLLEDGVRIYEYTPGFIHSKQMLVDDEIAFVGTINLDYRSLSHHFECGAILCRTPALTDIGRDFEELFEVSQEQTRENFKQSLCGRAISSVLLMFSPLF